tara:strand:- start:506221 stop:506793 length:573 start_codon:yes stop_codon:yes gene_type:complete
MARKKKTTVDSDEFHGGWELGGNAHAIAATELEWGIMRFSAAFERTCLQLGGISGSGDLAFQELLLLHVVAMQRHPQTAISLARQLNRDDVANLQYSLRKLLKDELIVKIKEPRGKTYTYDLSEQGAKRVSHYARIRNKLLTNKTSMIEDVDAKMEQATQLISLLTGIYDDVARASATYTSIDSSDALPD